MRGLARWRRSAFGLGCAAFFLSFFHRVSTGAIAADLQHEFAIGAAALGTLGAAYFYVYALMQVPAGVLADTLGPRVMLTASMLIAGIGSLAYGLAGSFAAAVSARAVIGFGVTAVFVCTLKLHANWFGERRFATAVGISNVSGICGALAATAPLAWLVTLVSWRDVHIAIGIYSLVLAVAIWAGVRDAPAPDSGRIAPGEWRRALAQVACIRATWAPFWVCFCTAGSFLTFVGLRALKSGTLRGAGLDVYENEPALDRGFLALKNVVLAPHIGSSTEATRRAMAMTAAKNAVAALTGGTPRIY